MARKTGKTTQTWCTFPANRSDLARKSGSMKAPMTPHWIQKVRHGRPALKVQRICICGTDSLTKSGKSTDFLRNQARLAQALQVGCFSRRDDLLATCSDPLATRHVQRSSRHAARHAARQKPTPYLQFLNKV